MEITQINLNGLDLRAWPYVFYIWGVDDIDKDIVTNDMFYDGQAWGRSKSGVKTLTINGYIKSKDNKYRVALNKAIAPNGLKPLLLTYSDGTQKVGQAEIQTRAAADSNPTKISLTLVMPDPYWYAQAAKSVQLGATYSAGVVFGATQGVVFGSGHGVVFGTATGAAATLTNSGNADAYPVITVVGTCSGISVTNLTTGETVAVSAALSDDDTLVIDCRPATCGVYLNGVANIGIKTSPGWMRCVPGDNQIVFSRNSLQNKKHCTIEINERWI